MTRAFDTVWHAALVWSTRSAPFSKFPLILIPLFTPTSRAVAFRYAVGSTPKELSTPSIQNKLLLYKAVIRSLLVYDARVWARISDTQRRRLQVVQNRILKGVLSAGRSWSAFLFWWAIIISYLCLANSLHFFVNRPHAINLMRSIDPRL